MNRTSFTRILHTASAAAALCFAGVTHAQGPDCAVGLTYLQQRLLTKAAEGPDALRRFIDIRRAIVQLDIRDTMAWAEAQRAARPECRVPAVAAGEPPAVLADAGAALPR